MSSGRSESFFASCPRGLEAVLARELTALASTRVTAVDGGVHFAGAFTLGYALYAGFTIFATIKGFKLESGVSKSKKKIDDEDDAGEAEAAVDEEDLPPPPKKSKLKKILLKEGLRPVVFLRAAKKLARPDAKPWLCRGVAGSRETRTQGEGGSWGKPAVSPAYAPGMHVFLGLTGGESSDHDREAVA